MKSPNNGLSISNVSPAYLKVILVLSGYKEKFFSFTVKTEFESKHRFDQCGIVMYLDSENWLKGSIEYENERFQHLGSVVTNNGYSDWATTEIDAEIAAIEEAAANAEEEDDIEATDEDASMDTAEITTDTDSAEDADLGTLADLESFNTNGGSDILMEEQEILTTDAAIILTEDDLPSPAELDSEKDFSENN